MQFSEIAMEAWWTTVNAMINAVSGKFNISKTEKSMQFYSFEIHFSSMEIDIFSCRSLL